MKAKFIFYLQPSPFVYYLILLNQLPKRGAWDIISFLSPYFSAYLLLLTVFSTPTFVQDFIVFCWDSFKTDLISFL
jgi:hypothetical protein